MVLAQTANRPCIWRHRRVPPRVGGQTRQCHHRRTGPVSFRGAEVSCPNIFSIACPKIQWFCPNITWFFARIWLFSKFQGGATAPPPRTPMNVTCAIAKHAASGPTPACHTTGPAHWLRGWERQRSSSTTCARSATSLDPQHGVVVMETWHQCIRSIWGKSVRKFLASQTDWTQWDFY